MYAFVICPVKSVRKIEHNGEDIITIQNLFKLEAGLQFKVRDYRNKNMSLDHLYTLVTTSKDYSVSATLSVKHVGL